MRPILARVPTVMARVVRAVDNALNCSAGLEKFLSWRGWRGSCARVCACGRARACVRRQAGTRTRARARAHVPLHCLHPRQREGNQRVAMGEGAPRAPRAVDNREVAA